MTRINLEFEGIINDPLLLPLIEEAYRQFKDVYVNNTYFGASRDFVLDCMSYRLGKEVPIINKADNMYEWEVWEYYKARR